ncbi:unknown [Prevotella sp. CAG:755]|nr:unknown [Prevotella sp. CAG:755]
MQHLLTLGDKEVDQADSLGHQAAAVAAQVKNKALHTLLLEVDDGTAHVTGAVLGVFAQEDIPRETVGHAVERNGRNGYHLPHDSQGQWLRYAGALYADFEARSGLSSQGFADRLGIVGGIAAAPRSYVLAVDRENDVTGTQTSLSSGIVIEGVANNTAIGFLIVLDNGADTCVFSCRHLL